MVENVVLQEAPGRLRHSRTDPLRLAIGTIGIAESLYPTLDRIPSFSIDVSTLLPLWDAARMGLGVASKS